MASVSKALDTEPGQRFADCRSLARAVLAAVGAAVPVGVAKPVTRATRKEHAAAAAVGAAPAVAPPLAPTLVEAKGKWTATRVQQNAPRGLLSRYVVAVSLLGALLLGVPVILLLSGAWQPRSRAVDRKGAFEPGPAPMQFAKKDKAGPRPIQDAKPLTQQMTVPGIGLEMVWIPPGTFLMGTPQAEIDALKKEFKFSLTYFDAEGPQHQVEITKGFYLGKYEVTQGEYAAVMGDNPSRFKPDGVGKAAVAGMDTSRFPVENVRWTQAKEFCRTLTQRERQAGRLPQTEEYRLPTEAEWEYACRGRTTRFYEAFHYGNSLSSEQANFNGEYPYGGAAKGKYLQRTEKVGSYLPNSFGLYDMHGNVWEWCEDCYGEKTYSRGNCKDPRGPPGGSSRVLRGGCWYDFAWFCRSASRYRHVPVIRDLNLGFRVARSSIE